MEFYQVEPPKLWGDYGQILIRGMTDHLPARDGLVQLERTGPFMPPITFPGLSDIVITDEFRRRLEKAPFSDLEYRPVIKAHSVACRWETWDRRSPEPAEVPESFDPVDYILARPHSPETSAALGELWQLVLPQGAIVDTDSQRAPWDYDIRVHPETWTGHHFFIGRDPEAFFGRFILVTPAGKKWLEAEAPEWVRFTPCLVK